MRGQSPRAEYVQREAASILYNRLILGHGPATVQTLADALGVCHSTITRQCTGDIPVQLRTVVTLGGIDPDGARLINELLLAELGFELRPALQAVSTSLEEAASQLGDRLGHATMLLCRFLGDGRIDDSEAAELEPVLPRLRWVLSRAEASLEKRRAAR
jgi:hypothetical protein